MEVKFSSDKKSLIITIPIEEKQSASGKSTLVASTSGNKATDLKYKDKPLVVAVNCYVSNKK